MHIDDEFQFAIIHCSRVAFTYCQMFGFLKNAKFYFYVLLAFFLSY